MQHPAKMLREKSLQRFESSRLRHQHFLSRDLDTISMPNNLTYEKILSNIKEQNYVEVPFLMPKEKAEKAAKNFINFLTLPQELKNQFNVIADEADRGSDSGYVRREKAKGYDNKEFFNYRKISEILLKDSILNNKDNVKVKNFFHSAQEIFNGAVKTMRQVIRVINMHHEGIYNKIFSKNPNRLLCLRFVKYDPAGQDKFLAKAHYDRGSCALAIAESAPGLRVGKDEGTLKEVTRRGNTAIFMPGFTFAEDVSSDKFTPAWHDVVQKSDNMYNKNVARWAIVLFADVKTEGISYKDTHVPKF